MGGSIKGVVLCGGKGVRLRPLTYYFQKTMIPIGPLQKPLLEYIIRLLRYHGVVDIVLLVGYKSAQIKNYFGNGRRFNVSINYVEDNPETPGTGGALLNAYLNKAVGAHDRIIVYYGDILSDINLRRMLEHHEAVGSMATLATAKGYKVSVGVVRTESSGRIESIVEKPVLPLKVGIGILALEGRVLEVLRDLRKKTVGELDIMGDLMPYLVSQGYPVYAYEEDCFWYDVGSTERYEKLDNNLVEEKFSFLFEKGELLI